MDEILREFRNMNAKLIVHEMLLGSLLIQLGKTLPANVEFIRSVMSPVEQELIAAQREAAVDKRELAEATREYFDGITGALLPKLPHGDMH